MDETRREKGKVGELAQWWRLWPLTPKINRATWAFIKCEIWYTGARERGGGDVGAV